MSLGRSRFQISLDLLEHLISSSNNLLLESTNLISEAAFSEVPLKQVPEDSVELLLIKVNESNDVEVSLETWSDEGSTTTWWTHGTNKVRVNDVSEWMRVILSIVPATLVLVLSKNFDWWLSSVLLNFRHVEIIDEDNASLSEAWAEMTLSNLTQLSIDDILNLVAVGLGRETALNDKPFVGW